MLKANSEAIRPLHGVVWFPGRVMEGFPVVSLSERALEIAKSREELLSILRDLPDSDRELSFSDLVERKPAVDDSAATCNVAAAHEGEQNRAAEVKERRRRRRSSFSSTGDGVLLNLYLPAPLTRSLTATRSSRGSFPSRSTSQSNKRERDQKNFGCFPALWDRSKGRSRRQVMVVD